MAKMIIQGQAPIEAKPEAKGKNFFQSLAKGADTIVGTGVFGTIGQIARHGQDVPVIGHIGKYVCENVRDGYNVADERIRRKQLAKAIAEITKVGSVPPNPEMLRELCARYGVSESALDEIKKMAEERMPQQGTQPFPAPAVAG
jgi:hypothetical protein